MPSIIAVATQIQEELDKAVSDQDTRDRFLTAREDKLDLREADLNSRERDLTLRSSDLDKREEAVSGIEDLLEREEAVKSTEVDQQVQSLELKKTENRLVDINTGIKQREEQVAARERAVSDREVEYKQQLRDEFFTQVAKGLPQ